MKRQSGFTLLELMIVVVVIAILSAIALPSYSEYVIRSRLTEVYSALGSAQSSAEQYWSNTHTYANFNLSSGFPQNTNNFTYNLNAAANPTSAYTITATAVATSPVKGFTFTIDQNGNKATTAVPAGWTTAANCWIFKKGGVCVQ